MRALPAHGGNVHAAARELRRSIRSILDFSASINPLGPSRRAIQALRRSIGLVEHYPDPDCMSLTRAIEHRWKISADRIVVGNGATELIDLIPRALAVRSAVIVGPTYAEYACAVARAGGRVSMIMANKADRYRPPLEEVVRRLVQKRQRPTSIDAVFLCHPNNPTGRTSDPRQLDALLDAADRANVWVVIDESFMEYCRDLTCVPCLSLYKRLIILRSFTKFYGLPGLRIGYSLSSRHVAGALRKHQPPWTVNAAAQQAAEAAIGDETHAQRSFAYLEKERAYVMARLSSLPGVSVVPSSANFVMLEVPPLSRASTITAALRRQGILIRDCSSIPGCTGRMIRVAVRRRDENNRLVAALARELKA